MADAHANFATSLVATAPSPATSGTSLVVTGGEGTRFPAVPFNATVCPVGSAPTPANAEIVRVTAKSTDTFTITRAQESSSARTVVVGDRIYAGPTVKTFTDIETRTLAGNLSTWWTYPPINASIGSEVATAAGTVYYIGTFIPVNCTLTGISILTGPTVSGTSKVIVNIYNAAGTDVAHSDLAGVTVTTANRYQKIPFTGTYAAAGPALYFLAASLDGTGTRLRHVNPTDVTVSGFLGSLTGSTTGTFGTLPTITPPTAPTASVGPVLTTY